MAAAAIPYGATQVDQSAFALGRVALNVIFLESNGAIDPNREDWTAAQLTQVRQEVNKAISFWEGLTSAYHPNARLSFDVRYLNNGVPLATGYEPISRSSTQDSLWINQAMAGLGYTSPSHFTSVLNLNQDSRLTAGTHWAATMFVVNDLNDTDHRFANGWFAYSHIGGPYMVFTYHNNGWGIDRFHRVMAHELGHIFFALDEYPEAGMRNNERSGYLNGINGNSALNSAGAIITPPQPNALMLNNTLDPSPFTRVQVGIVDGDGDGIPDILDTFPSFSGSSAADGQTGAFLFTGTARVNPRPNLNTRRLGIASSGAAMTINWIDGAEFRVNSQPWQPVVHEANQFGGYEAAIQLDLRGLAAGQYTIEVRAINSVGNASNVLAFQFQSHLVPEPSAAVLALAGGLALGLVARVRRGRPDRPNRAGGQADRIRGYADRAARAASQAAA